jgi:hypothetical protein
MTNGGTCRVSLALGQIRTNTGERRGSMWLDEDATVSMEVHEKERSREGR